MNLLNTFGHVYHISTQNQSNKTSIIILNFFFFNVNVFNFLQEVVVAWQLKLLLYIDK